MEKQPLETQLDFKTKFFYGFGSISFGIKNNGFSFFVLFVYNSVFGLPGWMTGLALNIILVIDAITDPLVGYYWSWGEIYEEIKPSDIAYDLASNFCFLTGVEGYTREANEPEWATKVIKLVQSQPIKKSNTANIDCDSPVYRNRPQCFDY